MKGNGSALFAGALWLGLVTGTSSAAGISGPGDFGQLSKNGFATAVNGAFYLDAGKTQFPNLQPTGLGGPLNTYSWSMAWFQNTLWVGTNRDALSADRVAAGPAEIWRYTPSSGDAGGDWGLSGTWQRVFVSPNVSGLISSFSGGAIPTNFPRDAGYRKMTVCNAGGNGTTDRLYATATGLPPNILYWTGSTFATTSTRGFPTTLVTVGNADADLGFRGLTCFKGRLFASPAGTASDVDIANHPVLLMNTNPTGRFSSWQTVVDVKNGGNGLPNGMADPTNIGIFEVAAVGDYLWLAVINRTTGFQLWRGDGSDCLEPWTGNGHCNITWAKIIDHGGGRPADLPGITPTIDNAGATLGVFNNDLYVAPAESGFYAATLAEMFRVPNAGSVPAGGPSALHQWQLIVGWPRRDYAKPAERLPGLENLDCTNVGDVPNTKAQLSPTVQYIWASATQLIYNSTGVSGVDPVGLDDDTEQDDCLPASNAGPGLPVGALKDPMSLGNESYFWRFAQHQGSLFVGTLDELGSGGFDLFKTTDGVNFDLLFDNGLGNPDAYGLRSLVSTPLGLFLGSANGTATLPNGGTDVFLGTTAPGGQAAPKANAGPDQFKFDTNQDNSESFTLSGSGMDTFGGAGLAVTPYEWFAGAVASSCASLQSGDAISTAASPPPVILASHSPNPDVNSYTYTLRVTNQAGKFGCDEVTLTASHHLAPKVDPWYSGTHPMLFTSVPATYSTSLPNVNLIDFGGVGSVSYDVTAFCTDPDKELVRCEFQSLNTPGVTLSNVHDTTTNVSCAGMDVCQIGARLTVPDWDTQPTSAQRPDVQVLATDTHGNQTNRPWESLAQPILDTPAQNDKPVCRDADLMLVVGQDTKVTFDPTQVDPPICVDPDGDRLTYTKVTAGTFPLYGAVTFGTTTITTITYTPTDAKTPRVDYFTFRATDPGGLNTNNAPSRDPIVRVTLSQDLVNPTLAVSFPASGGSYNAAGYLAGCTPAVGDVCGTAGDEASGVAKVQVSVRQDASGLYWDCAGNFNAPTEQWCDATGTTAWSYGVTPTADGSYTLRAKSIDGANNESTPAEILFSQQADNVPPTVAITFPASGATYRSAVFNRGCSTSTGDVCGTASDNATGVSLVQVSLQNASNAWWNGSTFVTGSQIWVDAAGTTNWTYAFSPAAGTYRLQARATDGNGNVGNSGAARTFTRRRF